MEQSTEVNLTVPALTPYDWAYGIAQLAAVFLSIIAGLIAISMFKVSSEHPHLRPWRFMIVTLVLFAVEEVLGALRTFGVWSTPHLTHLVPSFILGFLIAALINQIQVNKGWVE